MSNTLAKAVAVLSILMVSTILVFTQTGSSPQPSVPIGAGSVLINSTVIDQYGNVQAFIETGSTSPLCLITYNESNFAGNENSAFCDQRDFQGKHGVRVTFGFPFGSTAPPDFFLTLTVYQPRAHGYGQPILYTGP